MITATGRARQARVPCLTPIAEASQYSQNTAQTTAIATFSADTCNEVTPPDASAHGVVVVLLEALVLVLELVFGVVVTVVVVVVVGFVVVE